MTTAQRKKGRWAKSLNRNGDEMLYGRLATQTSKNGKGVLRMSPWINSKRCLRGSPSTRFLTSRTMRGSNSTATKDFALASNFTVKLPVPGPTSSTASVGRSLALSTIESTTAGFFKKFCPKLLSAASKPESWRLPPPPLESLPLRFGIFYLCSDVAAAACRFGVRAALQCVLVQCYALQLIRSSTDTRLGAVLG